ncbi:MAG: hypothetical protein ACK5W9_01500 [Bdellovibrionales bacterium]
MKTVTVMSVILIVGQMALAVPGAKPAHVRDAKTRDVVRAQEAMGLKVEMSKEEAARELVNMGSKNPNIVASKLSDSFVKIVDFAKKSGDRELQDAVVTVADSIGTLDRANLSGDAKIAQDAGNTLMFKALGDMLNLPEAQALIKATAKYMKQGQARAAATFSAVREVYFNGKASDREVMNKVKELETNCRNG